MMKKIVIINGSPKKNRSMTMRVTEAFVEGLKQAHDCEVTLYNVSDLNIKPCLGCLSCWGRTEGECVIKDDDINIVKAKIEEADYVIESFPLYFFGMPGIMKVFTDRMLSMMNTYKGQKAPLNGESFHGIRNPKPNRKFIVISSCAYTESDAIYESLEKQYDCICGRGKYLFLTSPQLLTLIHLNNEAKINKYLDKFTKAGTEYALNGELSEGTLTNLKKPPFSEGAYKIFLDNFWKSEKGDSNV